MRHQTTVFRLDSCSIVSHSTLPRGVLITLSLLSFYRVADALNALRRYKADHLVPIAAVATGFPSGQFPLKTRLEEIQAYHPF